MTIPMHAAVVGSGPSGFYAAEALLKALPDITIDMFERLPTPYGLVRSGVAPDHAKLKQVTLVFDKIMQSERFTFFGNVNVGSDVSVPDLRGAYDIVILAYGASTDRKIGIQGEDLQNSHSATEFVGWYNGHPDFRDEVFDLGQEVAVVVGHGNVAADVSRILLQPADELRKTDIAAHALEVLAESKVREVHLVGRRGPAQAKFTSRELRGLGLIPNCSVVTHDDQVVVNPACETELADRLNVNALQNVEFFRSLSSANRQSRRLTFHFCLSPERLEGESRVEKFVLRRNRLIGKPFEQTARATNERMTIDCGLVLSSIGYRGQQIEGVPFDLRQGVVSNQQGRVEDEGTQIEGLYVTGWLKRGPTGVIGTNRADSIETVQHVLEDLASRKPEPKQGREALVASLAQKSVVVVGLRDWLKIDGVERGCGQEAGKPREKVTRVSEMLDIVSLCHIHEPKEGRGIASGRLVDRGTFFHRRHCWHHRKFSDWPCSLVAQNRK
jgi:ferredoxin--NADP+ reductase